MSNKNSSVDSCETFDKELSTPTTTGTSDAGFAGDLESGSEKKPIWAWPTRLMSRWHSNIARKTDEPLEQPDHWSPLTRRLEEIPRGYPAIAAFKSSDRNFLQFRGFNYLHCRVLSDLQHGIELLEEELDDLDQHDHGSNQRRLQSRLDDLEQSTEDPTASMYPEEIVRNRPEVLTELKMKLLEYDTVLLRTKEMVSLQRPASRDYQTMKNWFAFREPITRREARYIRKKEDIVTLRTGRESAGFDGFVERGLTRLDCWLKACGSNMIQRIFLTRELQNKTGDETDRKYISYFAPARIDALVNFIITVIIFILLVLPVVVMYRITETSAAQSPLDAIGVLIVFTCVFGMAMSSLTTAKRHELFAASAAYAAVLVVFIGNFGVQQVEFLNQPK